MEGEWGWIGGRKERVEVKRMEVKRVERGRGEGEVDYGVEWTGK